MDPVQSPGQVAWGDYEPMGGLCIYVFLRLFMCVFICGSVRVLVCLWLVMYVSMCLLVSLHVCLCTAVGASLVVTLRGRGLLVHAYQPVARLGLVPS